MEHIRQYDWCASTPDNIHFLSVEAIDKSVTEKILRNTFTNPLISSDSEEDSKPSDNDRTWNWDQILSRRNLDKWRTFVAGLRAAPPFPRLSALSAAQHALGVRVLCARSPRVLPDEFVPRPTKHDLKAFEDMKQTYLNEQKEYIEWARTLWTTSHCSRALRPKPLVESVYEAEFKVRAQRMKGYPKVFEVVAQIPLNAIEDCEIVLQKDLIDVNVSELPQVNYPEKIDKRFSVLRPCSLPVPCEKHPVQFVLPGEKHTSILPLAEVHRELAMFASERGARFVASEGALRSLAQRRAWALPVTVHAASADGQTTNIIVLGSEFANKRENVIRRTFRAYQHLLEFALVPPSEMTKMLKASEAKPAPRASDDVTKPDDSWMEPSSDDEDNLFIDFEETSQPNENTSNEKDNTNNDSEDSDAEMRIDDGETSATKLKEIEHGKEATDEKETTNEKNQDKEVNKSITDGFGVYTCTCKGLQALIKVRQEAVSSKKTSAQKSRQETPGDTIFERPPPRSFRKFQFRNNKTSEHYDVIVHSAHKYKDSSGEVLIEPIIEYQADLGASQQGEDRVRSLALSLVLRKHASVMNVRIDSQSGDVITFEDQQREQFLAQHAGVVAAAAGALHTALDQLQGLVPGRYVMAHEPAHGDNALLYAPSSGKEPQLVLALDAAQPAEPDETAALRPPPALAPALLPCHKFRKTLPCAFTPYPNQVAKENKKPQKQKTPPQALKWPKKKGRKKKTN